MEQSGDVTVEHIFVVICCHKAGLSLSVDLKSFLNSGVVLIVLNLEFF